MDNSQLLDAAKALVEAMDKTIDDSLPMAIAEIVKFHSKGAAVAALASGWIPGAGATAAVAISAGFVWTMYGRINVKIDLPLTEHVVKSVASAVATNIAAYAVGSVVFATAFSLLPGLGNVASAAIVGGTCYALTLASGFVYLKILTNVFKSGKDPSSMTADTLKKFAKTVTENENIKAIIKEAKEAFKTAKDRGEITEEPKLEISENAASIKNKTKVVRKKRKQEDE